MFDVGAFTSGLVTGLREGVEAALLVSIILAYLARTGNRQHFPKIFLGTLGAVALSIAAGVVVFATVGDLHPPADQLFEAGTMVVAAVIVTWMLFWMRRQSIMLSGELRRAIDRILGQGGAWGLAVLAFTAVIREGLETSIFLVGQVTAAAAQGAGVTLLAGAFVGLAIAAFLGVGFYHGSRRIDLAVFFRWTGIGLVFIAAGLLSRALHEFAELGALPFGTSTVFDMSRVLPDTTGVGEFLRAVLGYSASPEALTLVAWLVYLVAVLALYLRPIRRALPPAAPLTPGTPAAST